MFKYIYILVLCVSLYADENFTLEQAIQISKKGSFTQNNIKEEIKRDKLNQSYNNYFSPNLDLNVQAGKELNNQKIVNDNFGYIEFKNTLYDKSISLLNDDYLNNIKDKTIFLEYSTKKRKITAMRLYLNAILASYNQQYTLEVLAMRAIKNNRAKDYYDTGSVSDIELLKTKTDMQFASSKKAQVDALFESTRLKLAIFLNLPIEKVYNLDTPNVSSYLGKKLDAEDKLYKLALKNDLILKQMNTKLKSLNQKINNIKNTLNVHVGSTVKYGEEPQKMYNTNDTRWEAHVSVSIPLYDAGATSKELSNLTIDKNILSNNINNYKLELKQNIYDALEDVKKYKKLNKAYKTQLDYRNLYLEKARVNYELDRQSDLGDSMVQISLAEFEYAKNQYNFVISYEILQLLIGGK